MSGIKYTSHALLSFLQKQLSHQGEQGHIWNVNSVLFSQLLSPAVLTSQQRQGMGSLRPHLCLAPSSVALTVVDFWHRTVKRGLAYPKLRGYKFTEPFQEGQNWSAENVLSCALEGTEWLRRTSISPCLHWLPLMRKPLCSIRSDGLHCWEADPALTGKAISHQ